MVKRAFAPVNLKTRLVFQNASTLFDLLKVMQRHLEQAGLEATEAEAVHLLAFARGWERSKLLAELRAPAPPDLARRAWRLIQRRAGREPLQYITGRVDFDGLSFRVGPGVLIPRPETELILDVAAQESGGRAPRRVADLGCGSGCLSLALARRYPGTKITGVDRSAAALHWARLNGRRLAGQNRVRWVQVDARRLPAAWRGRFDWVVANPPYIPRRDLAGLQPEVRREPRSALDGGKDGLEYLRRFGQAAHRLLIPGGLWVCEIGWQQARAAEKLFADLGFSQVNARQDWQGIARILSGRVSL